MRAPAVLLALLATPVASALLPSTPDVAALAPAEAPQPPEAPRAKVPDAEAPRLRGPPLLLDAREGRLALAGGEVVLSWSPAPDGALGVVVASHAVRPAPPAPARPAVPPPAPPAPPSLAASDVVSDLATSVSTQDAVAHRAAQAARAGPRAAATDARAPSAAAPHLRVPALPPSTLWIAPPPTAAPDEAPPAPARPKGAPSGTTAPARAPPGAGAAPAAAAALAATAACLLLLPWALYHRLRGHRLLEQDTRARLHAVLSREPGLPLARVARELAVDPKTARYHLARMARDGLVTEEGPTRARRYFLAGSVPDADRPRLVAERERAGVLAAVRAAPGETKTALARRLAIARPTLHWHLARLQRAGLVRCEREGRSVRVFPAAT